MAGMTPTFKINDDPQRVLDLLTECYFNQVRNRNIEFVYDEFTQKNLIAVTEALTAEKPKFGIWLFGKPGNGKTTMMYAIMRVIERYDKQGHFRYMGEWFQGQPRFKTAKEIVELMAQPREFNDMMQFDILCIDDLGTEPKEILEYGNVRTPMMDVIFHRYRFKLYTLVTSNLKPKDLSAKYDDRVADRCREMFHVVPFLASTYRKK